MNQIITRFEGCRLSSYQCQAGTWTIGFGHTDGVKQGDTITQQEAYELLDVDLEVFTQAVDKAVDVELTVNQMDALVSLAYNIGAKAFANSTLVKKLNAGDTLAAAMEFPKWSKIKGNRSRGLLRRRAAEMELFLTA